MHTSYVKLRNKTQRLVRKTQTGRCVRCYVRKEEAERSGDRQRKMGSRGPPQSHPNSAAISKGYNFASTWEQVSFFNNYSPNHASISVFPLFFPRSSYLDFQISYFPTAFAFNSYHIILIHLFCLQLNLTPPRIRSGDVVCRDSI